MSAVPGVSDAARRSTPDGTTAALGARAPTWRTALELVARFVVAGLFLYAAVGKLLDVQTFAVDVTNYRLLPDVAATFVAVVLPSIEVVIAVALVTGLGGRGAALLAAALLAGFTAGMVQALARGIDLECGCFGRAATATVGGWTIARNVGLTALALVPVVSGVTRWSELVRGRSVSGSGRREP